MTIRKLHQKRGWPFTVAAIIVKSTLFATTTHRWIDGEKLPHTGGCIVVLNHLTHIDPLTSAHFVYDHGRLPRYLAKSSLFQSVVLGRFMRSAGQIPVERLSKNAVGAYDAAVAAVRAGECVVVYPEGTLTRDPGLWPMAGKSGAARIALETGCPLIPIGQWGAQELLAPYAMKPDLFPRKRVTLKAGDPVDLSDLLDLPRTVAVVQQATDRIMASITRLVEDIRGERAPLERFDMHKTGVRPIGDPHLRQQKPTIEKREFPQ